jgi:hypothetical protein
VAGDAGEDLAQLELVVQIVLEPQHGLATVVERGDQRLVGLGEVGQDPLPVAVARSGEKRRPRLADGCGDARRNVALVQDVAPDDHRPRQARARERVLDAVAVHHVHGIRHQPAGERRDGS